jgi:Rrf2 family protein
MDIIRRNTDYALRAAVDLAGRFGNGPVGTKEIAQRRKIPYQLACKLMQKLHKAGLVKSEMGPDGGFMLSKQPAKITVREVVEAIQGPVLLSRCLVQKSCCSLSKKCPINCELDGIQKKITGYLDGLTLNRLVEENDSERIKI